MLSSGAECAKASVQNQSELEKLYSRLQIQVDVAAKNTNRLIDLSNKLQIIPPTPEKPNSDTVNAQYGEGVLWSIQNIIDLFRSYNEESSYHINQLESYI